jgi:hypothetical protein
MIRFYSYVLSLIILFVAVSALTVFGVVVFGAPAALAYSFPAQQAGGTAATSTPSPTDGANQAAPGAASRTPAPAAAPPLTGLSKSEVRPDARGLLLTVNGQPVTITGMNYNVNYTQLPAETKLALHRRDFQIMKDAGVNAVVGWGVYDEATLQVAAEFGIGVIMPYDLDPQGAYDSQGYRDQVKADFKTYIERYKAFPAVWAWNPGGDELLYRMDSQQHRTTDKLQAAADFLVELSTLGYTLDPDHVSVIKEPRDFYIPYLDAAMHKPLVNPEAIDTHDFWIFGLNVYGHPDDVLAALKTGKSNAEQQLGVALLVTEFAPFGLPLKDRASYYVAIWDEIQAISPNGGMVYVFGPDQPNPQFSNPYDPLHLLPNEFTLVDNQGKPVDGALDALAGRYRLVRDSSSH